MSGLTRLTFEGARAYANGLEERYRDQGLHIMLSIGNRGVIVSAGARDRASYDWAVSWDSLEKGLYDALRLGIDNVCREMGLGV